MPRLALYKGPGTVFDAAIRHWTDSLYSHCELIVGSTWLTSSAMDGGVRGKLIGGRPEHWDILDADWATDNQVMCHFAQTKGQRYGWLDVVRTQFLNMRVNQGGAAFCSEWCAAALGLPNPQSFSPVTLCEMVVFLSSFDSRPRQISQ